MWCKVSSMVGNVLERESCSQLQIQEYRYLWFVYVTLLYKPLRYEPLEDDFDVGSE